MKGPIDQLLIGDLRFLSFEVYFYFEGLEMANLL